MEQDEYFPLTVYYDGGCPLCSRKIAHYRRLDRVGRLRFVDIDAPAFDAGARGLRREELMAALHVQDGGGRLYRGVDAFRALWRALPGPLYASLGRLLGLPGVPGVAAFVYRLFARYRHRL